MLHHPHSKRLFPAQAVGLHAMRHWHRFRAAEVANLVWALAILKAPSPELWCAPAAAAALGLVPFNLVIASASWRPRVA